MSEMTSHDIEKEGSSTAGSPSLSPTQYEIEPQEKPDVTDDVHSGATQPQFPSIDEEKGEKGGIQDPIGVDQDQPIVVPRMKRRGLFGQITFLAEIENSKTFPRRTKWFITFIVGLAGAAAPMGSSIFYRR